MRAQLYDEPPLVISPSPAVAVGLHETIVLQQVHYRTKDGGKFRRPSFINLKQVGVISFFASIFAAANPPTKIQHLLFTVERAF